jgi:hypothetical protein
MAEYINIRGQNIEVVASDPANPTIGQIWYNSTSNTLKGLVNYSWFLGNWWKYVGIARSVRRCRNSNSRFKFWWCDSNSCNSNTSEEYDGSAWDIRWKFSYWKTLFSWLWSSNCCFSFWW